MKDNHDNYQHTRGIIRVRERGMKTNKDIVEEFNKIFNLEAQGCSECSGFALIDTRKTPYPKGEYHCELDLDGVSTWLLTILEAKDKKCKEKVKKEADKAYHQGIEQLYKEVELICLTQSNRNRPMIDIMYELTPPINNC